MNHIQRLQEDRAAYAEQVNQLRDAVYALKALALSPKHQGVQPDGERNDWIASADVIRWCDDTLRL